jgi:hypothetical protein
MSEENTFSFENTDGMDIRLGRLFGVSTYVGNNSAKKNVSMGIMPYMPTGMGSFATDILETPTAILNKIKELEQDQEQLNKFTEKEGKGLDDKGFINDQIKALNARLGVINRFYEDASTLNKYQAPRALIHPYALIKLTGACGGYATRDDYTPPLIDVAGKRRYYEVDGDEYGGYAKVPTTTRIIKWGIMDSMQRFPYSFQDFVFCKQWNKIPNNRLITLRRYVAPVTDNVMPAAFEVNEDGSAVSGKNITFKKIPFSPVATALTYFGEGTDNTLSEILSFSFHYNWKELNAQANPIEVTSTQNDEGQILGNDSNVGKSLNSALRIFSHAVGFINDLKGAGTPVQYAAQVPPDPYINGPYENRILGPINVIMDTYARERGLKFTHDSLKIHFDYVSRPISGINNKAILLDALSNIMLMTYASGTWFGGMWKYRCENPASYPWQDTDSLHKLYEGKIFGNDGFVWSTIKNVWSANGRFLTTLFGDSLEFVKSLAERTGAFLKDMFDFGDDSSNTDDKKENDPNEKITEYEDTDTKKRGTEAAKTVLGAIEKMIARRALKGASIPYVRGQKALLTGDVVGEWHLTIGNPLNPIAQIGNLIVTNASIKFSDELGPDDFPIGFRATIELKHGLGRDRDAIESMFNRGAGRIYTLSKELRTSADSETKVDEHSGDVDNNGDRSKALPITYNLVSSGHMKILGSQENRLYNSGSIWENHTPYTALNPTNDNQPGIPIYAINPWQAAMNL